MYIGSKWAFSQPQFLTPDPNDSGEGLIKTWHLYPTQNQTMISQARPTQNAFSFGIWYLPGAGDHFWLDSSTSNLQSQDEANIYSILDYLMAEGFECIHFLFAPGGPAWPDSWVDGAGNPTFNMAQFQQNWNYQLNVVRKIKIHLAGKPVKLLFDLSNEAVPYPGNPGSVTSGNIRLQYLQDLWANMTLVFGDPANGNHIGDMTFSIIPSPGAFQTLPSIFSGNFPDWVDLHIYGNPSSIYGPTWRNPYDTLVGGIGMLRGTGLQDKDVLITETNYNYSPNARQFQLGQQHLQANGWKGKIYMLDQWCMSIGSDNQGRNQFDRFPPIDAGEYGAILSSS